MNGKLSPLDAAMRRHPAGKRLTSPTGATVLPFRPVPFLSTATAETATVKDTNSHG